jgi:hypothetical protein
MMSSLTPSDRWFSARSPSASSATTRRESAVLPVTRGRRNVAAARRGRRRPSVRSLCQDLAKGKSIQPYIDGTLRKSPQLSRSEARQVVEDAIGSYCQQFAG